MFGPKSKSLVQLEHYLETRHELGQTAPKRAEYGIAAIALAGAAGLTLLDHAPGIVLIALAGFAGMFGYGFLNAMKAKKPTAEDEIMSKADAVSFKLRELSARRRLHLALHPGIGAVLNECAGYWKQIHDLSNQRLWEDSQLSSQWTLARQEWVSAADYAMAEALLLAEPGLILRPHRPRPEEVVEDLLDTYVFQRPKGHDELLPATFQPLRELAEKMKTLAGEVRAAQTAMSSDRAAVGQPDATHRLDQVLSNLRSINEAEEELQKHLEQSS